MKSVILEKFTQFTFFDIHAPRWHDKRVLLADRRIGEHNKVEISQVHADGTRYFPNPMYISGKEAKKYKLDSNGVIPCRAVPLSAFRTLELTKHSILEVI